MDEDPILICSPSEAGWVNWQTVRMALVTTVDRDRGEEEKKVIGCSDKSDQVNGSLSFSQHMHGAGSHNTRKCE